MASQQAGMAGTCFQGDGNIVKSFVPPEMLGMLDSVTSALNVDTIKTLGFTATNLNYDLSPVDAQNQCG